MTEGSGYCPKCHTEIVDYGSQELLDMQVYYPFTCKKCGFTGREWYDLTFTGFTDDEGKDIIAIVLKEGKDVIKLHDALANALGEQP
jgi:hypothetical protein